MAVNDMATNRDPVYLITDCAFSYRGNQCLQDINLSLNQNTFYGLIGPNGSGKTTLLNLLSGIAKPTQGSISFHGNHIHRYEKRDLAKLLCMVPQSFSMEFEFTVFEVVLMGRHPFINRFANPTTEDLSLVENALNILDIFHLKDRYVTRLSGGERQRVLVARALAQNAEVMILDEATASLDVRHSIDIMTALRHRIKKRGGTVVAAIHDLDLASSFCDKLIVMADGKIHASGSVKSILTSELLRNVFSVEAEVSHVAENSSHIRYKYSHAQV